MSIRSYDLLSFVYVLTNGLGHYKIGYSVNPRRRVQALDKGPTQLQFVVVIPFPGIAKAAETELHNKFKRKKLRSEWFLLEESDLEYLRELESKWIDVVDKQPFTLKPEVLAFLNEQLVNWQLSPRDASYLMTKKNGDG